MGIKLDLEPTKDAERILKELGKFLTKKQHVRMNNSIAAMLTSSTKIRFIDKKDPRGNSWKNWNSPNYRARQNARGRNEPASILTDKGNLRDTITYRADKNTMVVGSKLDYAGTMQVGNSDLNILARPFLGLSKEDQEDIYEIIKNYLGS